MVKVPKQPFVSITANGCGPEGMQIEEEFGLFRCCNRHDICFQSCGVTWRFCEKDFKKCMNDVCMSSTKKKDCKEQADMFSSMTSMFGSAFFDTSQDGVCECVDSSDANKRYIAFLREISSDTIDIEDANQFVTKYEKKPGIMVYKALKKYKDTTVIFQNIKDEL
jgi:secretory phospholipase A2